MRDILIEKIEEHKTQLLEITNKKGFTWGTAIRHLRGLPWRPQPAIHLVRSEWLLGKNGHIYVAAPDSSLYVPVQLPEMTEHRLRLLRTALESTLAVYNGTGEQS